LLHILDNLIAQKRIPPIVVIWIANGGGDAQGRERGKEYDNVNGDYADSTRSSWRSPEISCPGAPAL
jgi:enterochelin esterase-like enzyme